MKPERDEWAALVLLNDAPAEPITHWLDQSHLLILRTGCGKVIHSYALGAYDATTEGGEFLHIAPHGPPSCKGCRSGYDANLAAYIG